MIELRAGTKADEAFIYHAWLKTMRWHSQLGRALGNGIYPRLHAEIARVLPRCKISIAHPVGDPDTIVGYVVVEKIQPPPPANMTGCVHFLYVKKAFRRMGIARRLIQAAGWFHAYSQHTDDTQFLLDVVYEMIDDVVPRVYDPSYIELTPQGETHGRQAVGKEDASS